MTEIHYIYSTVLILLFIIISMVISSYSVIALQITEVELNPLGSDSNQEWVELYSDSEINLEDYTFINGDGKTINFKETFSGYKILLFEKQWLDNSNETISLSSPDFKFKTPVLADSKNNDFTWQLCNDEWEFKKQTKNKENECNQQEEVNEENKKEQNKQEDTENVENNMQISSPSLTDYQPINVQQARNLSPIRLQPEKPKEVEPLYSPEYNIRIWLSYGFSIFVLLILVLVIRNKL